MKEKHDMTRIYTPEELIYSAYKRCRCGAGLAYPKSCKDPYYFWGCGHIMSTDIKFRPITQPTGPFDPGIIEDENGVMHDGGFSFVFYEIKPETCKCVNGSTTRGEMVPVKLKSKKKGAK